jgi:hypothetical protein
VNGFLWAIETYCKGLETVAPGCAGELCEHGDAGPEHTCEPSFGWEQCDSCGSTLGGDRMPAYGLYRPEKGAKLETIEMTICIDCVLFHANGDTPEHWEG